MNVFVAGATGLLGRNVVRQLVAGGHRVRALSRSIENEKRIGELGAEPASGDLFHTADLVRLIEGTEAVLHLATKIPNRIRPSFHDFAENDRLRTEGTAKLLEAARAAGARLYFQQSIAFVAATRDARVLRDDDPCTLPAPAGSPIRAALQMEELVRRANRPGFATVILRGGLFYHAESFQTRQLLEAVRKGRLPIFGSGENIISLIHADDMATAVIAALEKPAAGEIFFVVDDRPIAFKEYINIMAALIGVRPARHWPEFLARPLLGPVMGILPKISFNCPNTKFKQATGWKPQFPHFAAGMQQVLDHLKRSE